MKYSEIGVYEKINDTRNLIFDYSRSIIADIDKILKERKPRSNEAPYYDLIAESFFSIQSFCMLVKEGLISSACAILRVILEQVSIAYLLSKNNNSKEMFLQIKNDMIPYLVVDKEERKTEDNKIRQKYNLSEKLNINAFFDYGWCTTLGCKSIGLKSICEKAGTTLIYDVTTEFLHGFAHGQRSIHQFYRRRNGVDKIFINNLHLNLFELFYKLLDATTTEFGNSVVNKENSGRFNMIECLIFDIRTRLAVDDFYITLGKGDLSKYNARDLYELFVTLCNLLDLHKDRREKYLLSQAYMRLAKLIIATIFIKGKGELLVKENEVLSMEKMFDEYKPQLAEFKSFINLDKLLEMMDRVDDDWAFGDDDIDYAVANGVNYLIQSLLDEYKIN